MARFTNNRHPPCPRCRDGRATPRPLGRTALAVLLMACGLTSMNCRRAPPPEDDLWRQLREMTETPRPLPDAWHIVHYSPVPGGGYEYRGPSPVTIAGRRRALRQWWEALEPCPPSLAPANRQPPPPSLHMARSQNDGVRLAFFERTVLEPLLSAAKELMKSETADSWSPATTLALRSILAASGGASRAGKASGSPPAQDFELDALLRYALRDGGDYESCVENDRERLLRWFSWCYAPEGAGAPWPPPRIGAAKQLSDDSAIDAAMGRFSEHVLALPGIVALDRQIEQMRDLIAATETFRRDALPAYLASERAFYDALETNAQALLIIDGFRVIEPVLKTRYSELSESMHAFSVSFSDLESAYRNLSLMRAPASVSYEKEISVALDSARAAQQALVPATVETPLVRDAETKTAHVLLRIEERFRRPELPSQLAALQTLFTNTEEEVSTLTKRFPDPEPSFMPPSLSVGTLPWASMRTRLPLIEVATVNDEFARFGSDIGRLMDDVSRIGFQGPTSHLATVRLRLAASVHRARDIDFTHQCERALDAWRALTGNPGVDRKTLLGLPPEAMATNYGVRTPPSDADYLVQYWSGFFLTCAESLADAVAAEADEALRGMRSRCRFPLVRPSSSLPELSPDELPAIRDTLRRLTADVPSAGPDVGRDGATSYGDARIARLLDRLRRPLAVANELWLRRAACVMAALPDTPEQPRHCAVSLLPAGQRPRNAAAPSPGQPEPPDWAFVELDDGDERTVARIATAGDSVVLLRELSYPGHGLAFRFYGAPDDPEPAATVAFSGAWGCIRLLHDMMSLNDPADPAKWTVRLTARDNSGAERAVWLQLAFDPPLPPLSEWPDAEGP